MEIKITVDSALVNALNNLANALSGSLGSIQAREIVDNSSVVIEKKANGAAVDTPKNTKEVVLTLEDVRTKLADVSRAGKQEQVRNLILKYGSNNLTGIDPKHYASLLADVEAL